MYSCFALVLALLIQGPRANPPTDALAFLSKVTQRYADAKSYHIEATIERTTRNELSLNWQKMLLTAIVAPGGRYRYEGWSGFGSAVLVSNGTSEWDYHADEHQYTNTTVLPGNPKEFRYVSSEEIAIMEAKGLVTRIASLSKHLKSAAFLPDETIPVNGQSIECRVVHFTNADLNGRSSDLKSEESVWVDKARKVIVKTARRGDGYTMMGGSSARIPIKTEETTVYRVVKLDAPEPDSSFTFSPPPDAKLVASFPSRMIQGPENRAEDFLGKPAPEIHLKRQGEDTPLSSLRGKPVFVDFWSTFCEPCVELLPGLKELYAQTHDKGLVWVGIDKGDDAATMEDYARKEHIPWPNYHDADGSLSKAFECWAIPLGVLIDPSGKVTYYGTGYSLEELRAAIAKLGPEFSGVVEDPRVEKQKR